MNCHFVVCMRCVVCVCVGGVLSHAALSNIIQPKLSQIQAGKPHYATDLPDKVCLLCLDHTCSVPGYCRFGLGRTLHIAVQSSSAYSTFDIGTSYWWHSNKKQDFTLKFYKSTIFGAGSTINLHVANKH